MPDHKFAFIYRSPINALKLLGAQEIMRQVTTVTIKFICDQIRPDKLLLKAYL